MALTLLTSALAACSGQNTNDPKESPATGESSTPGAAPSGDPVTLTVEIFDRGIQGQPDLNDNTWTRYINENFGKANNAIVKFVPVPRSQEIDKLNVLMAAGEAPDISFTYDGATVSRYAKSNGIMQLDDLLEEHGQDLKNYLGETVLTYGRYNGKLMAIPAKRTSLAWIGSFIRKDWLDKLGLPVPTTREELYEALIAFRDKNPGGVDGVIPWGVAATGMNYGYGNLSESFWEEQSEEEFVTMPNWLKPGNKEALKFLNKLYNEGLISPDFALDKTAQQADADVTNGKVGFFSANWDYPLRQNISEPLRANVPEAVFVPIDAFKNDEGKYKKIAYNENGINVFIPKSSKNAELAMKYLNWMSNPEVLFFLQYGEEGVNHKMVNGIPQVINQTGDNMQTSALNLDYTLVVNGVELGDQEKNIKALAATAPGLEEIAEQSYKINTTDSYTGFFFDTPNEANIKFGKTLGDLNKQMTDKLIVCKPSEFDGLYDSLVQEYMAAGGQAVMDESVQIYRAMQEANK
ncbi:extracellular solute-binding protein [Paenibacillus arenilitoris]|uniref:Extracellular solute-binding protein n=1 Tax=Paenibacillus arenilitoris TaxID=2772299 RepID=A0A927CQI5_9BACL|nr:extracellular solute-binding protein [Paenibacillus arenilitoris]MBD2871707.1 extracellular solute-binding protein [Paenibacillus arenilitoris]